MHAPMGWALLLCPAMLALCVAIWWREHGIMARGGG
jgi:hypothetical protein